MRSQICRQNGHFDRIPHEAVALALRVFPAMVFFQSGRTKVEGLFSIKASTWFLFENEYALPVIPPRVAAVMAATAENVLPVLMILGLAARLPALCLLGMTLVIQIFVYPGAWITHSPWAATLLALIAIGPGTISLDRLLGVDGATRQKSGRLAPAE